MLIEMKLVLYISYILNTNSAIDSNDNFVAQKFLRSVFVS